MKVKVEQDDQLWDLIAAQLALDHHGEELKRLGHISEMNLHCFDRLDTEMYPYWKFMSSQRSVTYAFCLVVFGDWIGFDWVFVKHILLCIVVCSFPPSSLFVLSGMELL